MKWDEFWTWVCLAVMLVHFFGVVEAKNAGNFDKASFKTLWLLVWGYFLSLQQTPTEGKQ
jgi:hypothetical protein